MSKKNNATIYIVRHGESEFNISNSNEVFVSGKWGETGEPLTQKGKAQAEERAEQLRDIHFDAIFSSDLSRAIHTAEIIKRERQLEIQTTKILRERKIHFPNKTIKESQKLMKNALKELDEKAKMTYKPDETFESPEEAANRIATFLQEIAVAYRNKTVLVTNHANNMRSLLTYLGYAKYDELPHGTIENTGYIVLECDGADFFIKETHGVQKKKDAKRGW